MRREKRGERARKKGRESEREKRDRETERKGEREKVSKEANLINFPFPICCFTSTITTVMTSSLLHDDVKYGL